MSTYMYLDSNYRINLNETATNYIITPTQGSRWSAVPKDLSDNVTNWTKTIVEIDNITLESLYIYSRPILKLNFYDLSQTDNSLMNSLDINDNFRFLLQQQSNNLEWKSYTSNTSQAMLLSSNSTYKITLKDIDNNELNDVTRSLITIKLTPIERYNIKYKDIIFKEKSIYYYDHV